MSGILHLFCMSVIIRDEKRKENKDNLDVWTKKDKNNTSSDQSYFFLEKMEKERIISLFKNQGFHVLISAQQNNRLESRSEIQRYKREDEKEELYNEEKSISKVLDGFDMEINEKIPTEFYCNCSRERVEKALISIGRKELNEMIQEGQPIEMNCHFCNHNYEFTVEELKEILRKCK